MQNIFVFVAALSISVCCALSKNFIYIPRDVFPRFQTEQEKSIYVLNESKQANRLCSVYFRHDARDKCTRSPVSLLRFVYDEAVARFVIKHAEVDTERKLFFVFFATDIFPVQAVPEGIAEVSVLGPKENSIDYLYKKEREHGNIFDRFLIAEEFKREDKEKIPRIKSFPAKRKETVLLLSFLAAKESQLYPETVPDIHGEKGNGNGLKLPYGVGLFVSEENSCSLDLFDLTETKIKKLTVSSFDITKMNLKSTHIEELVLVDE
ncbi:MAG: uncharacterized protein A8A55_2645, partial [Amphiamblys sp. WSBS2006]